VVVRYLADSSVWVEHLRGNAAITQRLLEAQSRGVLVMCEPVAMELLAGASADRVVAIDSLVNGIPGLAVDSNLDFRAAAAIRRAVRAEGNTVRSILDCLIASIALRNADVVVAHNDVDFERISSTTGLSQERWAD